MMDRVDIILHCTLYTANQDFANGLVDFLESVAILEIIGQPTIVLKVDLFECWEVGLF